MVDWISPGSDANGAPYPISKQIQVLYHLNIGAPNIVEVNILKMYGFWSNFVW